MKKILKFTIIGTIIGVVIYCFHKSGKFKKIKEKINENDNDDYDDFDDLDDYDDYYDNLGFENSINKDFDNDKHNKESEKMKQTTKSTYKQMVLPACEKFVKDDENKQVVKEKKDEENEDKLKNYEVEGQQSFQF